MTCSIVQSRKPAVFFLVRMRVREGGGGKEGKILAAQRDVPRGGPRLAPQLHLLLPESVLLCLRGRAQVVRPSLLGEV